MRRIWKRVLVISIATAAVAVTIALAGSLLLFERPATYRPSVAIDSVALRSWPEHDSIYQAAKFPYVLKMERGPAKLLYVGAQHTSDATNPQLAEIERLWAEFKPTVALCEGRASMFKYASRPATGTLRESELVRILAQRSGVTLYTLEPEYDAEVSGLLRKFEPRLVATYLTLRVFTSEAKGHDGDRDALALHLLRKRTDAQGLRGSLSSVADLDAYWRDRFPGVPDWRTLSDTESVPLLVEVGNASREIRGAHMVRTLVDLAAGGERVFAVVGASHVIRQEPALAKEFGEALPHHTGEAQQVTRKQRGSGVLPLHPAISISTKRSVTFGVMPTFFHEAFAGFFFGSHSGGFTSSI